MIAQKSSISARLYNLLFYSVVSFIVLVAVMVSIARVLLLNVESYQHDIETLAGSYLERVVKIGEVDARFVGITPTLVFKNVRLMDKSGKHKVLAFDEARVGISLLGSWQSRHLVPSNVVVEGAELVVTRNRDGKLLVQGIDVAELGSEQGNGTEQDLSAWLFERTDLALLNSVVVFNDKKVAKRKLRVERVNVHLQNNGAEHSLRGFVSLPEKYGKRLDFAMSLQGNMQLPETWQGKFYLNARSVDLHRWSEIFPHKKINFQRGQGNFSLWADVAAGRLERISTDVMLTDLKVDLDVLRKPLKLKFAGGLFDFQRKAAGWSLAVDRFQLADDKHIWPVSRFSILGHQLAVDKTQGGAHQAQPAATQIEVVADYFRIEDVASLAREIRLVPKKVRSWLSRARPTGDVSQLRLRFRPAGANPARYELQAKFKQFSMRASRSLPGVHGISGNLWLDQNHGRGRVSSGYSSWKFPRMISLPVIMTGFNATLNWQRNSTGWQVWSDRITARNDDIETHSQFQLDIPDDVNQTFVDLQIGFANVNVGHAKRYFPYGVMGKGLDDWLQQSTMSGEITDGGVVFRGRLADFPYLKPNGQFVAEFSGRDIGLGYLTGWPKVKKANLHAHFDSKGLAVDARGFTILSTKVKKARIRVADFSNARLILNGNLSGPLKDLPLFLVKTPIHPQGKDLLAQSSITGKAATKLHVEVPLTTRMEKIAPLSYRGEITTRNGGLTLWDKQIDASELNGTVLFSDKGESAHGVKGKLFGHPADFELSTHYLDKVQQLTLLARSRINARQVMRQLGRPPNKLIQGNTDWNGALHFAHTPDGAMKVTHLQLNSSLKGIRSDLPAPLNKKAQQVREFSTTLRFQPQGMSVSATYDHRFAAAMRLANHDLKGLSINFGPQAVPLPDKPVIRLSGRGEHIALSAWRKAIRKLFPSHAEHVAVLPVELAMTALDVIKEPQDATAKKIPAPRAENIPLLSGSIEHLTYHGIKLGKLSIQTSRIRKGIKFDHVELRAPTHHIVAVGQWKQGFLGDTSYADVSMQSDDLGQFLEALGYSAIIKGGKFKLKGNFAWPDTPMAFSLGTAMGKLHLEVQDGRVTDVDAGAGRLLGLFSLVALPRRLGLDFKDTFESGFSFDEMSGDFEVKDGSAFTSNLTTKSPVATIVVKGRTGYVARDFDQQVFVTPKVGDSLPVTGALLFGLEIGAAIALIDTIMGKQIDKASRREYHVTGSWEKPVITEITPEPDNKEQAVDFDEDTD